MAAGTVIDLLSSDDDATFTGARNGDNGTEDQQKAPTSGCPSYIHDEFNDIVDFDDDWMAPSMKKRKRGPSILSTHNDGALPCLPQASKTLLPKPVSKSRHLANEAWTSIDVSDPIVFTSSIPVPSRSKATRPETQLLRKEESDEDLLEDMLYAPVFPSKAPPILSERTAALLTSLSQTQTRTTSTEVKNRRYDKASKNTKPPNRPPIDDADSVDQGDLDVSALEMTKAPKRSKLTEKEKSTRALEKDQDKAAKAEAKKKAKAASREQKAKEREEDKEKKRQTREAQAREKRIAADLAEVNKLTLDKKDSTPEMIIDLPASIDGQSVHAQIKELHKNLGVDVTMFQSPVPNTIKWRRKWKKRWIEDLEYFEPLERISINDEKHVMCLMSAKEFVALAMTQDDENLETHVAMLQSAHPDCTPIYMIEGLKKLLSKNKNAENRAYQVRVLNQAQANADPISSQRVASRRSNPAPELLDENKIEDALLNLQITYSCLVHQSNGELETAEWVAAFTQHISTIPYRQQRMNFDTSFCMESGQIKTGEDKDDTFAKMLQEVVRVTPSIAFGIASEYPNVLSLVRAFRKHGPLVLEDLYKSANKDGASTDRRIGPAISRRLYKMAQNIQSDDNLDISRPGTVPVHTLNVRPYATFQSRINHLQKHLPNKHYVGRCDMHRFLKHSIFFG